MAHTETEHPYIIVVAIDFSLASDAAVREAFRIAAEHPVSEIHAVHVIPPTGLTRAVRVRNQDVALDALPERMREYVTLHSAGFENLSNETRIGVHMRLGRPAQGIVQMSVDARADLVVVGTHGRDGLNRIVAGSVAEHVVRSAHCPVLVARAIDYEGLATTERIEPPCPDCLEVRARTNSEAWWCERHQARHREIHTYSAVAPVRWVVGAADVYGAGTASTSR
jgi:nucleotide-binding universal stress UspA family protein